MSTKRKTVAEQITEAQEKIKQEQNALKKLQAKQKEQDNKARNHRLCKRHGLLESLLPDTKEITDEQFKEFLEQHIANSHGRKKLAEIVARGTTNAPAEPKNNNPNPPKQTPQNAQTTAPPQGTPQGEPA
jgi:hypothetical protein